jgi:putative SOS response-associated peptidase YedK
MCGRFSATFEFSDIRIRWNLERELPAFAPRFNIAPGQLVRVIIRQGDEYELKSMRWGLVPSWASDRSIGQSMINARAETLGEKPSFKELIAERRCLVPADGFYEWRREGKRKVPLWVHLKNKEPFGFAGLWDVWRGLEGDELYTFTIITTEANELLRPIHNRMPVIFDRVLGLSWLDPLFCAEPMVLGGVLQPFPSELMETYDVSALVNSPGNDTAECIQPISYAAITNAPRLPGL